MNTESLKTFLTLAEVRNFRKAAQQLFVVQSTVSSRIQDLEKEMGQKLFERNNKTLSLTPAGQRLVPYAREFLNLEKELHSSMELTHQSHQTLTVGISYSIYDCYIQPHIPLFLKKNPDITLNILHFGSSLVLNALQDDKIDIGISFLPNYEKSYQTFILSQEEIVLPPAARTQPIPRV